MSTGKIELSVGAVKYVDPNEIITEEEYNYIKNKTPELDERVGVIEDEIEEINSSLEHNTKLIDEIGISYSNFNNFSEMENYINSKIIDVEGSNSKGNIVIDFPSGDFTISDIDVLSKYQKRVSGLKFRGRGVNLTRIYFKPENNDQYLFKNNDKWLSLRFEGISFIGDINKNTNFMYSKSDGGAQNYVFTDCGFSNWNIGIDLKGTNNNSEFAFYNCSMHGTINNFLYCGSDVGVGGDQFLNYNFFACNFEVAKGNFINMYRGGNINVYGGSFIHIDSDKENAEGGTFFKFPYNSHSYGVCRLFVNGVRFEHRNRNSKLIDCMWNTGNIEFLNCDSSCYYQNTDSKNWTTANFYAYNVFPNIKFNNTSIIGKHDYKFNAQGSNVVNSIVYDNCSFNNDINDIFTFTPHSTPFSNNGAYPNIKILNSNVGSGEFNYLLHGKSIAEKKILILNNSRGSLPNNNGSVSHTLPIGSIITKCILYCPPNAVTSGMIAKFQIKTNDETILVDTTPLSTAYNQGFDLREEKLFICDTLDKATIILCDTNNIDQQTIKGLCLIEYV